MNISTVKTCPCCGGDLSEIFLRKDRNGFWHANAFCGGLINCGISIDAVGRDEEEAKTALLSHWNKRADFAAKED